MSFEQSAGMERYDGYEAELDLVKADLDQKLAQLSDLTGEARKTATRQAEASLEEAKELLASMKLESTNVPTSSRQKVKQRLRNSGTDVDTLSRNLASLSSDRSALFGPRYTDDPLDEQLEQRSQLLSGTERLSRSSARLAGARRVAEETEGIGAGVLRDLAGQRETIVGTRERLLESEGYTDRSIKTLKGMARRMATNRIITISIITILVLLIIAVLWSKFR